MKTSLILFATAAAVPFFTLAGLSGIGAFSIMTALSIVAMLALDYDHSRFTPYVPAARVAAPTTVAVKTAIAAHPLAA